VTAYVIYLADVHDPERYEAYKAQARPHIESCGGRYLVRGGEVTVLEGQLPARRTVVLEFPDVAAAVDCLGGAAYAEIRTLRGGAADVTAYVVEGIE